jgi:hypothetical protein
MLARVKRGALLINTSRGGLVDTEAVIEALKSGQLGGIAIDVYEQKANLFFRDLSSTVIADDVIQRLVSFPNVIVTGHQAFFTREALGNDSGNDAAKHLGLRRGPPAGQRDRYTCMSAMPIKSKMPLGGQQSPIGDLGAVRGREARKVFPGIAGSSVSGSECLPARPR